MRRHWVHDRLRLTRPRERTRSPIRERIAAIGFMVAESRQHPGPVLIPGVRCFDFSLEASRLATRALRKQGYRVALFEKIRTIPCVCWGHLGAPKCALYGAATRATVRKLRRFDLAVEIALARSTESEGGLLCIASGTELAYRFSSIFLDLLEIATGQPRQDPGILSLADLRLPQTPVELIFVERANPDAIQIELSPRPGQSLQDWYGDGSITAHVANAVSSAIRETIQPRITS